MTLRPLFILLVALALPALTGCERVQDGLYEAAMDVENARAGLERAETTVDDIRWVYLHNTVDPERETVVLLHGFSADRTNWPRFAGAFGSEDYNLVIPDLPGHGETSHDENLAYDIDTQARRVLSLMTALEVKRFHVAGNSMGGAIAARMAWLEPSRIYTLGLFNAAGAKARDADFDAALKEGINPLIVRTPEDMDRVIAYAMAQPPFIPWPLTDAVARRSIARAALNEKIFRDLIRDNGIDQQSILPVITARTLILWGEKDRLLHVDNAALMETLMPNARRVVLSGIGHLPMLEAPEDSARIYRDFLAGREVSAP